MTYLEIIKANNELQAKVADNTPFNVRVLSNIMLTQLKEPYEHTLRSKGINATLTFGDYDNIVQESVTAVSSNTVILFWEASNLIEGLHYKSLVYTDAEMQQLIARIKSEIDLVINNLKTAPVVILNRFSTLLFNSHFLRKNNFDHIADELNKYLESTLPKNFMLVDIDKVIAQRGIAGSFNKRFWYSSKMLYSTDLLISYAQHTAPVILSILGKGKKALVLDCDNTMWKGIVGEDLTDGIACNGSQKNGVYFEEVQYLAQALNRKGVVLAINSKNNAPDVDAVFTGRPDMPLKADEFLIKKVNWQDKVTNLKEIAKEINIGIDSLVHMDDSDFEVNYIKANLPEVQTIQVPTALADYPETFRANMDLFFNLSNTTEDAQRNKMYRDEQLRDTEKEKFESVEDYLKSLELELEVHINDSADIERVAQMTQKTNQFNLTTPRYTESEISNMLADGKHEIFSFSLKDKFGNYGKTALGIVNKESDGSATVDTLLMSCRIIGRNVEKAIFDVMIDRLKQEGINTLNAAYIKTPKNSQVESLYDTFGLQQVQQDDKHKKYILQLNSYNSFNLNYIKVNYGN